MADNESEELKSDPLHKIRERYRQASEYWSNDREAALDDIRFRAGAQWPTEIIAQRNLDKRPCLTVDKLSQYVRQVVNDGRQNRPAVNVTPVDSGADVATSEIFQGAIRHIETRSGSDVAYDTSLDNAATCGFGYFQIATEYVGGANFDQEIKIKRIRNPMSVLIDPGSQEADGSDMKFCFVTEQMSKDEFKEKYPDKKQVDFITDESYQDWYGDDVRVARYWCVEETSRMLYLMRDGNVVNDEQLKQMKDSGLLMDGDIVEARDIPDRKVMVSLVSGKEYLEEPKEWPGKWIPVFPVWGNETDIEGKVTHSGIIRPAKDAARLYNYSRSAFAERVALTPKAPWVAEEGQVADYENDWKTANTENISVLRYTAKSIEGHPIPAPQRQTASDIPSGFAQDMQIAEHDIQASIGMYAASVGAPSNERSGKAISARQKEGDVGSFHYHDNLNRAIRHCGKVLVDLIPKVYKTQTLLRILGYDGKPGEVKINQNQLTASQKVGMQMVYNLGVGNYDVSISAGPSYNTLRMEAAESMTRVMETNPALMSVAGDLYAKWQDWPGAQEFSERLELALAPEIKDAIAKKKQDKMPPEMQQAMAQFDQVIQQKDATIARAANAIEALHEEIKRLQEDKENKDKEMTIRAAETEIKLYDAETKRELGLKEAMTPGQVTMIVRQMLADIAKPNTAQLPQEEQAMHAPEDMPDGMPEMDMGQMPPANVAPQAMGSPM